MSALPNLMNVLTSLVVSKSADKVVNSGKFETLTVRKIFTSVASLGTAFSFIMLAFSKCHKAMSITAMCLSSMFRSFNFAGFVVSLIKTRTNVELKVYQVVSIYFR